MGIDWEFILGSENSEDFEDLYCDNIPDYDFPDDDFSDDSCEDCLPDKTSYCMKRSQGEICYAQGYFKGERIRFNRLFADHKFSDDEVRELLNGNALSISYNSRNGRQMTTTGHLQHVQSDEGRWYFGFIPEFDKRYSV